MKIEKTEKMNIKNKRYTKEEYRNRLEGHYATKVESIHIMGEYAQKLHHNEELAMRFLRDYFTIGYEQFKTKYNLLKEKISRPITQKRLKKILARMSDEQKAIIDDQQSKAIMILAGPGSGKTKVLVHKIASLILMEDVVPEQFMMLTFSRTAVNEFRDRLHDLLGAMSKEVEINTFHSYAFKLIARMPKEQDGFDWAIEEATRQIRNGDIKLDYKSVLVLDEYQDINPKSFEFVKAIHDAFEGELRIIAVGDDDQCIMGHAGADIELFRRFEDEFGADAEGNSQFKQYELLTNYRSHQNIIGYNNTFLQKIQKRQKTHLLIPATDEVGHVEVISHASANLISPVVQAVVERESALGVAVLAYTNEEVMQLFSLLSDNGIKARYVIDRSKFNLKDVVELVTFDRALNVGLGARTGYAQSDFDKAMHETEKLFEKSKNFPLLTRIVDKFLDENDTYPLSQWQTYLDEITLEEFEYSAHSVMVSTIHKSKGKEFDSVYLIVHKNPSNDNERRLYYVGMSRAKYELFIHRNGKEIELSNQTSYAKYRTDDTVYLDTDASRTYVMSLSDIKLGWHRFDNKTLQAGITLEINEKGEIVYQNRVAGKLSKKMKETLDNTLSMGYRIESATLDYVVRWYDKEKQRQNYHPLCVIRLAKHTT